MLFTFSSTQDIAENGCSAAPEQSLPRPAPSPLVEKKDTKLREDRRPITVHFGQVRVGVRFLNCVTQEGAKVIQRKLKTINMPVVCLFVCFCDWLCCYTLIYVISV